LLKGSLLYVRVVPYVEHVTIKGISLVFRENSILCTRASVHRRIKNNFNYPLSFHALMDTLRSWVGSVLFFEYTQLELTMFNLIGSRLGEELEVQ